MLSSFAFFPGYTKGRLSYSLLQMGLPGMCRHGAGLLTPYLTPYLRDPHRCTQHHSLASETLLVLTSKTIGKSFLLFLLFFPTSSFSLSLSPFSPPPLPPPFSPFNPFLNSSIGVLTLVQWLAICICIFLNQFLVEHLREHPV